MTIRVASSFPTQMLSPKLFFQKDSSGQLGCPFLRHIILGRQGVGGGEPAWLGD